jgi:predicted nucleic acid-binding protein
MIYVDSSIIIRLIEGVDKVRIPIEKQLQQLSELDRVLVTSRLSCLECRCKPLREKQTVLLDLYRAFFTSRELILQEVTAEIVEKATLIRAEIGFKTPDALHASTAILSGVSDFWTTDVNFRKSSELNVELFPSV